jgi:hypothetical protein
MQKFKEKLKNSPTNAPLVCSSENSQLNKDQSPSVEDIVLSLNSSEVDQSHSGNEKQDLRVPVVYVLNIRGKPLMPTSCRTAKVLLKAEKAKVVKRVPFTIQLNYPTGEAKQNITLGIDTGYSNIGFSAVSNSKELISGTLVLENGMTKRLQEKLMYRRGRRNRLWYREPRFLNRGIKEGWLPPSVIRRSQTHVSLIERIKKLLPISKIRIEVANFDIQKIENPSIEGVGYQQGTMYEYRNRIAYLISREKGKCQFCNKEYQKKNGWRLHHIWGKEKDRPSDWALLHSQCHDEIHEKHLEKILREKKSKSYKDSIFMNIVRWKFKETFPDAEITYGNITFQNRIDLDLEKNHVNDAFVIAEGKNKIRINPFEIIQKKRNNRCLQLNRKGYAPSIRKQHYKIQPKNLIKVNSRIFEVKGIHSYGNQIQLKDLLGNVINKAVKKLDSFHFYQGTLVWSICG